ncbi:MAG: glycine cleavage system aminomethyltransferase GcvT [Halanaerobiaceae bacterium]
MKKTVLYETHQKLGAKLINFHGWEMPLQYSGIIEEHRAVRNSCGLFDISHMGELQIEGKDAVKNLQYLVTNNVKRLSSGQILYTPMCYHHGGIIDDLLVYCLDENDYMLVVNAANIDKDYKWIENNVTGDIKVRNISESYALLALQGPESKTIVSELTAVDLEQLDYYRFKRGKVGEKKVILSRTGYTGEHGYEIYVRPKDAVQLWNELMIKGRECNLLPAGLGARDTLRLEKKYCLYGNDIDQDRHPLEAGLSWTVQFDKGDFIGREALLRYKKEGYPEKLTGFKIVGRGIPRPGYKIKLEKKEIGTVTSGSYSPSLEENIGLGYVKKEYSKVGQKLEIIIRNKPVEAIIVETPFL